MKVDLEHALVRGCEGAVETGREECDGGASATVAPSQHRKLARV